MYLATIKQFHKVLGNLDKILGRAIEHAEKKKFDPNIWTGMRLTPDMFPLSRQIQIATDVVRSAAANLAGQELTKEDDNETTLIQLRDRIRNTRTYLAGFTAANFTGAADRKIKVPNMPGKAMLAEDYLLQRAVPNFYFHVTTIYALLRIGAVDIGKVDYLGDLPTFDL